MQKKINGLEELKKEKERTEFFDSYIPSFSCFA